MHTKLYGLLLLHFVLFKVAESAINLPLPILYYFEDLLALPIILSTALYIVQRISIKWREFTFRSYEYYGTAAFFSFWFEVVMPINDPERFTADPMDVICYFAGALAFNHFLNKPSSSLSKFV